MKNSFHHKGVFAIIDAVTHHTYGLEDLLYDIVKTSHIPVIQLRLRKLSLVEKSELIHRAIDLKNVRDFTLIINDDADFLSLSPFLGLHVRQENRNFAQVRHQHPKRILGLSTHNLAEAKQAVELDASYITCGAVFSTREESKSSTLGIDTLKKICQEVSLPKVAIGGINQTNIEQVALAGADMAAMISGLVKDKQFVGQKLHEKFLAVKV